MLFPCKILHNIFRWDMRQFFAPTPLELSVSSLHPNHNATVAPPIMRQLEDLSQEVVELFSTPCNVKHMLLMSARIRQQFHEKLESSTVCMLPSFCHTLPTGQETGAFVALDVGGSTCRVALVELMAGKGDGRPVHIKSMLVSGIDEQIRRLPSTDFFDWVAGQIRAMLEKEGDLRYTTGTPVPLGLAWSFPIEQTSTRSGLVQSMGKGFMCQHGTVGKDLGEVIQSACTRAGFQVRVEAIINDSSAVLISQAYLDPATSMGLITGTGMNATAFLPVSCMGSGKFGQRSPEWFATAQKVVTNTELSMFGKGILPETRWDEALNQNHSMPDFQPLEYMTTGRYLGEILRLIIVEAVKENGLFEGVLPTALQDQYSLHTHLLAEIEQDRSHNLRISARQVKEAFGLIVDPSDYEMAFLATVTKAISRRAAAYLSTGVHALWALQKEYALTSETTLTPARTSIACNGSVILKYPGFKQKCESYLAHMVAAGKVAGVSVQEEILLHPTHEAAIVGAAVAVAMACNS